jgi:predicted nucleic acid-binding protein
MFILDSNIYIEGFNNNSFASRLRGFHQTNLPRIILSAVVLSELLVGANSRNRERVLRRTLIEPFRSRRRILVPTLQTWESASAVDRRLRSLGSFDSSLAQRGFFNDILIAASAREIGATVITKNLADFALIARVLDVRFAPPWPPFTE